MSLWVEGLAASLAGAIFVLAVSSHFHGLKPPELRVAKRKGNSGRRLEARGRIELPIKVLQTFALPLGYRAPEEETFDSGKIIIASKFAAIRELQGFRGGMSRCKETAARVTKGEAASRGRNGPTRRRVEVRSGAPMATPFATWEHVV
jgi:hypothetical protein